MNNSPAKERSTRTRIDAHHHLWRFNEADFSWISDEMAGIRKDFLLPELRAEITAAGVNGTVAVQARQTTDETRWLLQAASGESPILGVVGWLPLQSEELNKNLDAFLPQERLKGLRHVVQEEASGFLDGEAFNHGIRCLRDTGLTYDILISARQIPEATRFVNRHPDQAFVLDHLGKPDIRHGEFTRWAADIAELAKCPTVACKISGMVTEADPLHWSEDELRPYFDTALEAFGPERLMAGTDWPVLTVGCSYAQWWGTIESWIADLSPGEHEAILGGTAARVYQLQLTS